MRRFSARCCTHGANVHARTTGGDSALHLAASVGATGDVIEQLVTAMSQCPLQPRSVCCQRVALTIGLHDSFGRSVLARAVVNGTTRTVEQLLALMPKSGLRVHVRDVRVERVCGGGASDVATDAVGESTRLRACATPICC
jgi:hypothetical protein